MMPDAWPRRSARRRPASGPRAGRPRRPARSREPARLLVKRVAALVPAGSRSEATTQAASRDSRASAPVTPSRPDRESRVPLLPAGAGRDRLRRSGREQRYARCPMGLHQEDIDRLLEPDLISRSGRACPSPSSASPGRVPARRGRALLRPAGAPGRARPRRGRARRPAGEGCEATLGRLVDDLPRSSPGPVPTRRRQHAHEPRLDDGRRRRGLDRAEGARARGSRRRGAHRRAEERRDAPAGAAGRNLGAFGDEELHGARRARCGRRRRSVSQSGAGRCTIGSTSSRRRSSSATSRGGGPGQPAHVKAG